MGVDRLRWKEKQPFYNVLVEDGSCRYAASENLFPTKPQRIVGNPQVKNSIKYHRIQVHFFVRSSIIFNEQFLLQVGKYFVEFDENIGYIANSELTQKYPEDNVVQLTFQGAWRKDRNSLSSNGEIN